jgi:arsenate reductase-like glutaredoxin family protein
MLSQLPPKAHLVRMIAKYKAKLQDLEQKRQRFYRRLAKCQEQLTVKEAREREREQMAAEKVSRYGLRKRLGTWNNLNND